MAGKTYRYTVTGHGSGGATFECGGLVYCEFHDSFESTMIESFRQLTHGKAVYGNPGIGCQGPYEILRVVIEQVPE